MTLALCSSTLFFANQKETVSLENEKNQTIENVDLNEIELSNKMKSIDFQKFLKEDWYWFYLCGNEFAIITESYEEAMYQAFEYYLTHPSCNGGYGPNYYV